MNKLIFFLAFVAHLNCCAVATKDDWNLVPMTDKKIFIPLQRTFLLAEFDAIREGLIPQSMDDRWVIFVENEHIYIHRSWTGHMIYDCILEETKDGILVTGFYANRDQEQYTNQNDEYDVSVVNFFLQQLVDGSMLSAF